MAVDMEVLRDMLRAAGIVAEDVLCDGRPSQTGDLVVTVDYGHRFHVVFAFKDDGGLKAIDVFE